MGDLSKNFSRHEFECECGCEFDTVDAVLLRVLQGLVDYFTGIHGKVRCKVLSGDRCVEHNEEIQREYNKKYVALSSKSKHTLGKAADIRLEYKLDDEWVMLDPVGVEAYLDSEYPYSLGLGIYSNRNHVDSRDDKARWTVK